MKKALALFLCLFCFVLCGCQKDDGGSALAFPYDYDLDDYITLGAYRDFSLTVPTRSLSYQIDSALQESKTEHSASNGDTVKIEIISAMRVDNAENVSALIKGEKEITSLGAGSYDSAIERAVLGLKIGGSITQELTLDGDFEIESLQGVKIIITLKLSAIQTAKGEVLDVAYTGYYWDEVSGRGDSFDSSQSSEFFLGSGNAIEDFEKGLTGVYSGTEVTFFATFPSDYGVAKFQNKKVQFVCTVNKIYSVPNFDDDFAQSYYSVDTTDEAIANLIHSYVKSSVLESVVESSVVSQYPQKEYDEEASQIASIENTFYSSYGVTYDEYLTSLGYSSRDEYIKSQIKLDMIYYSIARKENVTPTEDDLAVMKEYYLSYYTLRYIANYSLSEGEAMQASERYVENLGQNYIYENALKQNVITCLLEKNTAQKDVLTWTYVPVSER